MKQIKEVLDEKVFGLGEIAGYKVLYGVGIRDLKSMVHLIDAHKPDVVIRVNKTKTTGYTLIITSLRSEISAAQLAKYFLELGIDNGIYKAHDKYENKNEKAYVIASNINIFSVTCRAL